MSTTVAVAKFNQYLMWTGPLGLTAFPTPGAVASPRTQRYDVPMLTVTTGDGITSDYPDCPDPVDVAGMARGSCLACALRRCSELQAERQAAEDARLAEEARERAEKAAAKEKAEADRQQRLADAKRDQLCERAAVLLARDGFTNPVVVDPELDEAWFDGEDLTSQRWSRRGLKDLRDGADDLAGHQPVGLEFISGTREEVPPDGTATEGGAVGMGTSRAVRRVAAALALVLLVAVVAGIIALIGSEFGEI